MLTHHALKARRWEVRAPRLTPFVALHPDAQPESGRAYSDSGCEACRAGGFCEDAQRMRMEWATDAAHEHDRLMDARRRDRAATRAARLAADRERFALSRWDRVERAFPAHDKMAELQAFMGKARRR